MNRRRLLAATLCLLTLAVVTTSAHAANVLLVTQNNGTLTAQESLRKTQFEAWGHTVNTIWDAASQATFDAAFLTNDVVYISEEASGSDTGYKPRNAPIGVVNEERRLCPELGISSSDGSATSARDIYISDNSHEITSSFSTGWLRIVTGWEDLVHLAGSTAPGGQTLATLNGDPALFVIEVGGQLANTYGGNSTAAGRRVQLPFGDSSFDFNRLRPAGLTLLENAINWAAAAGTATQLIGHWKLDEGSGTTAADSSAFGSDGTVYGGANWSNRCTGVGVFDFDGSTNYVSVPNGSHLQPTEVLTIAAWVRGDSWGSGNDVDVILRKGEDNPNNYQLAIADRRVVLYLDDFDTVGVRGNTVLAVGEWYHVAAVWDGSAVSIYVNGQLDNTPASRSGTIGTDSRPVYIGGHPAADVFDGMIYDVRFYNYALNQAEIVELYGQVGHWKLDETSGATAADSSGLNNDGNVFGPSSWTDGHIDGAIQLNGNARVDVPSLLGSPANVTMAGWADLTARDTNGSEVFSIGDYFAMRLDDTLSSSYAFFYNGSNWTTLSISQTFEGAGWHHFAIVFNDDQNSFEMYVDGIEAASTTTTQSIVYAGLGTSTTIGRHGNGQTRFDFTGRIDDVRVYNRALCPGEIQEIYSTGLTEGVRIIKWVEIQ